jgi:hypothetical protein
MRYRLRTLLIGLVWLGLVLVGLREPTPFWSGAVALFTLFAILLAVLFAIYRTDQTRVAAIGFLVFCVGYLIYVGVVTQNFSNALSSGFVDERVTSPLFNIIHPEQVIPLAVGGDMILPPPYEARFFLSVCNHALAFVFGIGGAISAKMLQPTARPLK